MDSNHSAERDAARGIAEERRQRSQKLDSLGRMAGGIAHDFNNLLLAIMGNADLLDQDLRAGRDGFLLLDEIRKAAGRAADLCNQLFAFAGQGQFNLQPLDLSTATREMSPMLKVAVSRRVAIRLDLADKLPLIEADPAQIHQIIMNLVVNASESIGAGEGTITIGTGSGFLDPSDLADCVVGENLGAAEYVYLEIRDTGEGMEPDTLQRIFDPYFTSKVQGRGLGLGSVLGIVRGHQAVLCVDSEPGEGSCFRIHFQSTEAVVEPVTRAEPAETTEAGRGTILAVDDEEYVRVLSQRMLSRLGYRVILAASGAQAVEIFSERKDEIDCVVLDLIMPEMDGVQVFEHLVDLDPQVKVVLTSGYHEQEIATRFVGKGIQGFLQKPYVVADLAEVLSRVLAEGAPTEPIPGGPGRES